MNQNHENRISIDKNLGDYTPVCFAMHITNLAQAVFVDSLDKNYFRTT